MVLIELPLVINIQVNELVHRQNVTSKYSLQKLVKLYGKKVRNLLPLHVHGIQNLLGVVSSRQFETSNYEENLLSEKQKVLPWELLHDFRRVHSEVATTSRFLTELSILLNVLAYIKDHPDFQENGFIDKNYEAIRFKPEVFGQMLMGRSIYKLDGLQDFPLSSMQSESLIFETLSVAVQSPFLSKLRANIRFDKTVNMNTIMAAMSLFMQINIASPEIHPVNHTTVAVSVTYVNPSSNESIEEVSMLAYLKDLRNGGVKTTQQYLDLLKFKPGKIDGINGANTQSAVKAFCKAENIAGDSYEDEIFINALAVRMSKMFPILSNR